MSREKRGPAQPKWNFYFYSIHEIHSYSQRVQYLENNNGAHQISSAQSAIANTALESEEVNSLSNVQLLCSERSIPHKTILTS